MFCQLAWFLLSPASVLFQKKRGYDEELPEVICPACSNYSYLLIHSEVPVWFSAELLPARKAGQPIKYKRVYKLQAFIYQ